MAETKPTKAKRRVKNPETFREKVVKAAEGNDKPPKTHRVRATIKKVLSPVFRPIGKLFSKIGKSKAFKPFKKPLAIIGKILVPPYVRSSWAELKQVTWPTWRQSVRLTFAVLVFAVIFAAIVSAIDYGLDKLFKEILLK